MTANEHGLHEQDVLTLGKVIVGSRQPPRELRTKQKVFPDLPPNWVIEPYLKILIVKTWVRPGALFKLPPSEAGPRNPASTGADPVRELR